MRVLNGFILAVFVAVNVIVSYWIGQQAYSWLPPQASAEAIAVDELFSVLVSLGSFIFFGVIGFIFYSIVVFRASRGDLSDGVPIEGNTTLEIVWTAIPVVLVLWIAFNGYKVYQQMGFEGYLEAGHLGHLHQAIAAEPADATVVSKSSHSVENIEVMAKQWAWSFYYPRENVSSSELHLPLNQRVRFILQSEDVIHGFYVPEFRLKQDIIPAKTVELEVTPIRIGKYRLHDSQFSGTYFAVMEADVYVDSPENYAKWLQESAARDLVQPENRAVSESEQPLNSTFKSGWKTVKPAQSPNVNAPSHQQGDQ